MRRATRRTLVAWLYCAAGGAAALGLGCIPDLPADATDHTVSSALCGDGYVDLSAGEQCDPGPNAGWDTIGVCNAKCQIECDGGFVWPVNNHCYQVALTAADLDPGAISQCSGGHVVTFGSEEEFNSVTWAWNGLGLFWVGLTTSAGRPYVSEGTYEPGWASTCPGCYAYTPDPRVPLRGWDEGGALDAGGVSEQCVAAYSDPDVSWCQYPCVGEPNTHVVCEREPVGEQYTQCDAGLCIDLVVTRGKKHYVYEDTPTAPDAAEAQCVAAGGTLVVFGSRDEREQLWKQLSFMVEPPSRFWIGLQRVDNRDAGTSTWVWDDGTSADAPDANASPWGDQQPVDPGKTWRAYMRHSPEGIDDTLARNDETETLLPFVCQFRGDDNDSPIHSP